MRYWGVGNEVYGSWQMGHRPAERYAADAREHALFMRRVDPDIRLIGVGWEREEWTRPVLTHAGDLLDSLSIHLYGGSDHLYAGDERGSYAALMAQSIHVEREIHAYADMVAGLADELGIDHPLSLALDEWNMRHLEPATRPEPQRGANGGTAPRPTATVDHSRSQAFRVNRYSPRTLADALFYAGVLHALQRMSGLPVAPTMANTVNLVNANSLLEVRPGGLVRSATYHVWDLLQNRTGPIAVRAETESPGSLRAIRCSPVPDTHDRFPSRPGHVPDLDISATLSGDHSRLHVSVINRHPESALPTTLIVDGSTMLPPATIHELGSSGDDLFAHNTLDRPDVVSITPHHDVPLPDGRYDFPAHSVSMLTFSPR